MKNRKADEFEGILRESVVAELRYYSGICLEGLRKATKTSARISCLPTEIRTEELQKTSLKPCR
jgi:hypothetical protein